MNRCTRNKLIFASLIVTCVFAAFISGFEGVVSQSELESPHIRTSLGNKLDKTSEFKSPVHFFRLMLEASPEELKELLSNKPPEVQTRLLEKIKEYRNLSPTERELKLQVTELQWYFLQLVNLDATNRLAKLELVPPEIRKMLEERLTIWDILPPPVKDELSQDVRRLQGLIQVEFVPTPLQQKSYLESQPSKTELQEAINRLSTFFTLNSREREQLLKSLSKTERMQVEKALEQFHKLPPRERARCLSAFSVLAEMSPEERIEFLKNAEKWQSLAPDQRQAWRRIVREVPTWPPTPGEEDSIDRFSSLHMNGAAVCLTNVSQERTR